MYIKENNHLRNYIHLFIIPLYRSFFEMIFSFTNYILTKDFLTSLCRTQDKAFLII